MRRLTGRIDFRRTFWGRIVLQVEEETSARWSLRRDKPLRRRWRFATVLDLTKVELRPLIDLRRPRFSATGPASDTVAPERMPPASPERATAPVAHP